MTDRRNKNGRSIVLLPILVLVLYAFNVDLAHAETFDQAWNNLMNEYHVIISYVAGLAVLTSILIFIAHFINLAKVAGYPTERAKVLNKLLISGICTTLLGGMSIVLMLYFATFSTSEAPVQPAPKSAPKPAPTKQITPDDLTKYAPDDVTKGGTAGVA